MKYRVCIVPIVFALVVLCWRSEAQTKHPVRSEHDQPQGGISLLVVGDWGTGGKGARRVGDAMAQQHAARAVHAIISTGDNIYPSGVADINDAQWESKFESVYPASKLPVPFWAVLGNHDYRKNPQAQVEYTGKKLSNGQTTRWHMPGRFWSTVFHSADGSLSIRVIGIDTQQLVAGKKERESHLALLDSVLTLANEDQVLVVGHHPVYSHGHYGNQKVLVKHLAPRFRKHRVLAYLNGHEHDLQLLRRIDGVRYIISGGGGGTRKTGSGENTEFVKRSLGFFRLDISAAACTISVIDDDNVTLHHIADAITAR